MRITSKRALAIYALIGAFLIGVVFLIGSFAVNGETWALKRFNQHLFTGGSLTSAGTIYDTKGVILAQTKDGERIYNDSRRIRKATLHMVGDTAGYISTGIHTIFRSELTGYNLVDGVYRLMEDGEGNNIRLTINAELCATALDALGDRKGTVGVYNYKTGEILCMVSSPTYDPERKPTDIDTDKTGKYDGIYLNRFLSGVYTPGSTFKTITAISAIDNIPDIFTQKFTCKGKMQTSGGVIYCNEEHGHGTITFEQALNRSCNVAFAQIAIQLGAEKLTATDKTPHAWFAGFSQNSETPYAFVVVVENGGSGYQQAIPVANKVLAAVRAAS